MTYTIGEVAKLTDVPAVTLRAWESRYGVVHPVRSTSSYRQYDDQDVEVLHHMRALVQSGIAPRHAAALAVTGEQSPSRAPDRPLLPPLQDTAALSRAGAALDGTTLRRVLDEAFTVATVETAIDDWLIPSLREVGRRWQTGELDVVAEHFVSAAVMRKLSALFETTTARGPRVAVGLPTAARHELPALAFALLLQRTGTQVLYVGADVPQSCWARLAETWRPSAAVIGVACDQDVDPASAAVQALTASQVARVFAGGHAAQKVTGAIPLTSSLTAAATTVAQALGSGHTRPGAARDQSGTVPRTNPSHTPSEEA